MSESTTASEYLVLPSSEVAVGHCVIINDCDCPGGNLVALVTSASDESVEARYLSVETGMRECRSSSPASVTPVGEFGVEVRHDGVDFWCEVVGGSVATYEDGEPRSWQELHGARRRKLKDGVLRLAMGT